KPDLAPDIGLDVNGDPRTRHGDILRHRHGETSGTPITRRQATRGRTSRQLWTPESSWPPTTGPATPTSCRASHRLRTERASSGESESKSLLPQLRAAVSDSQRRAS